MREKRTEVDFSKHVHRVEIFKNEKGDEIRIDHFQVGNNRTNYIQFINTDEILTITGDFGNWVFCRPFVPSPKGYVSDGYWFEKMRIASEQKFERLDSDANEKEIRELIDHGLEDYGYEGEDLEKAKQWYDELLSEVDDDLGYMCKAYRDYYKPDFIKYENIPMIKETPISIQIIFDAFDEMCLRLENSSK